MRTNDSHISNSGSKKLINSQYNTNRWICPKIYGDSMVTPLCPFHLMPCCSHVCVQLYEANKPFEQLHKFCYAPHCALSIY